MKNNYLILLNDIEDISEYKKLGVNNFAIYLKDYSVFFEKSYNIKDIKDIDNVFLFINKLLNNKEIEKLKEVLNNLPKNIKGLIISDLGIYNLVKDKNLDLILNIRHFGTNYNSINSFLDLGFKSYILSNEITLKEIEDITKNLKKKPIIEVLSHNIVSYSKRKLISNYNEFYNENLKNNIIIEDKVSNSKFLVKEEMDGTIFATNNIYNAKKTLSIENVLYYFINTTFLDKKIVIDFINNNGNIDIKSSDEGFLDKETIYKIKRGS